MTLANTGKLGLAAIAAAAMGMLAALGPAQAHHSFAMYDMSKEVTLTGRMDRIIPGANHAQIMFTLLDEEGNEVMEGGKPVIWGVETGPAAMIARQGVNNDNFPKGSILTISLSPLKDGRNFGVLARGVGIVNCGQEMPEGGCTPETGESYMDMPQ